MMLFPVSPPSSLSTAERPGAIVNIEPSPGGTIKPFGSILISSPCLWRSSQLLDQRISVLYQKRRCKPAFLIGPPDRAAVAAGELSASEFGHPRDEWHVAAAAGQAGFEVNVSAA